MGEDYTEEGSSNFLGDIFKSSSSKEYEAEIGEGIPTKGSVQLTDKGQYKTFGTLGTGSTKEAKKSDSSADCTERWMEVSVYAKEDFSTGSSADVVLLELGNYGFS